MLDGPYQQQSSGVTAAFADVLPLLSPEFIDRDRLCVVTNAEGKFKMPDGIHPIQETVILRRLKVSGGSDKLSRLRLSKLIEMVGDSIGSEAKDVWQKYPRFAPLDDKILASILRWYLRGLDLQLACAKANLELFSREVFKSRHNQAKSAKF